MIMFHLLGFAFFLGVGSYGPGYASQLDLNAQEQQYIRNNPTLKVQLAEDWPPFNYTEDDTPQGYVNAYIQAVAEKAGLSVEFVSGHSWQEYMEMLLQGELDCITNMTITERRAELYGFSQKPVVDVFNAILVKNGSNRLDQLESFRGQKIAVVRSYSQQELLQQFYPEIELLITDNLLDSIRRVMAGEADGAIGAHSVFNFYINKHLLTEVHSRPITSNLLFPSAPHHLAVQRDNSTLLSILDKAAAALTDRDEHLLQQQWLIVSSSDDHISFEKEERAYLHQKQQLHVCVDPDWMPIEKIEQGKHIGIAADYMVVLGKKIGVPIVLQPTDSWQETLQFAQQRKCDFISMAMATPERRQHFYFTKPYLTTPLVVATHNSVGFLPDLSAVRGEKIGFTAGYAFGEELMERYPDIDFVSVSSIRKGLDMVRNGALFGHVDSLLSLAYTIQQGYSGELKIACEVNIRLELNMAVRNDEPELLTILNKAVDSLEEVDRQQILNRWVSVTYQGVTDFRLLYQILAVAAVIISLLLYRYATMRRYTRKLQQQNAEIIKQTMLLEKTRQQLLMVQYAVDSSTFPIFWIRHDVESNKAPIVHANAVAAQTLGYSLDEFLSVTIDAILDSSESRHYLQYDSRDRPSDARSFMTVFRRKDESTLPVELFVSSFEFGGNHYDFLFFNDISEQLKMKRQLHRSMQMETVGLMAGGVAHDLNNILSGIVSYPELVLMKLPADSELRAPLEAIHRSGKQAAETVADLLTVARGGAIVREIANINMLINEYCDSPEFRDLLSRYPLIQCNLHLARDLQNSLCSPLHIRKSIMNLVTNAFEATEAGGRVTITTGNIKFSTTEVQKLSLEPGNYVVITVEDSGPGIPADAISHIFEPFYSKKVMGKSGTGLGLTIVWNTAQDHGGTVTAVNRPSGTQFEFYLPATQDEQSQQIKTGVTAELLGNGERILVVDDEQQQLDVATHILEMFNYSVYVADSGSKAVNMVSGFSFDLVLLDMIMVPGISGKQTYREILRLHPQQKAVIVSGFAEDEEVQDVLTMGAASFLRKPYSLHQLAKAVKDALADPKRQDGG